MSVGRVAETIQLVWTAVVLSTETERLVTVHVDLVNQASQKEIVTATETFSMSVAFVADLVSQMENVTATATY
jgi:S-methylmethionine-dependent homocysteine/selenocysteine methylase